MRASADTTVAAVPAEPTPDAPETEPSAANWSGDPVPSDGRTAPTFQTLVVTAVAAAVGVLVVYLLAVRTESGQRLDDLAFDGRRVQDPDATRVANDVLHSVTRSSLFLLTAGLMLLAFARRRIRLALLVGATVTASVVTTELLKTRILGRPMLDDVTGIEVNSYPSGHATIGMSLALGLVMVTPSHRLPIASGLGSFVAVMFGIGVLATGWHRPSDVLGAFLVCAAWFLIAAALIQRYGDAPTGPRGHSVRVARVAAGIAGVLAVGAAVIGWSLQDEAVRLVDGGWAYLVVCAVLLCLAVGEVIAYALLLRRIHDDARRRT